MFSEVGSCWTSWWRRRCWPDKHARTCDIGYFDGLSAIDRQRDRASGRTISSWHIVTINDCSDAGLAQFDVDQSVNVLIDGWVFVWSPKISPSRRPEFICRPSCAPLPDDVRHSKPLAAPAPSFLKLKAEADHSVLLLLQKSNRRAGADPVIDDDAITSEGQGLGPGQTVSRPPVFWSVNVPAGMAVGIERALTIGEQVEHGLRDGMIGHRFIFRIGNEPPPLRHLGKRSGARVTQGDATFCATPTL
jgi:hypothetical protein